MSINQNNIKAKIHTTIRWIFGVIFVIFILGNGFHYSSLFLLISALLMLPLSFVASFLQKIKINTTLAIVLSVVFLFVGIFTSPSPETNDSLIVDTNQTTAIEITESKDQPTETESTKITTETEHITQKEIESTDKESASSKDNATTETESVTSEKIPSVIETEINSSKNNINEETEKSVVTEKEVIMVWVSGSGKKYHSKSTCSNMKSPRQIPLEEAQKTYTPCSKCY